MDSAQIRLGSRVALEEETQGVVVYVADPTNYRRWPYEDRVFLIEFADTEQEHVPLSDTEDVPDYHLLQGYFSAKEILGLVDDKAYDAGVPAEPLRITVEGGIVQAIDRVPLGLETEVWDFDTEGVDEEDLYTNESGDQYVKY